MRHLRLPIAVLAFALCATPPQASAQTLALALFERYLEALRQQAGIPGMSAAVIEGGAVVWERGLGRADLDTRVPATADTPFAIGGLTQALSSTVLLQKCLDESYLSTLDPVQEWFPQYPEPGTRIGHLLAHAAPGGGYNFDLTRFAALTPVTEACTQTEFRHVLDAYLFTPLAMTNSAPGAAIAHPTPLDVAAFTPEQLARFADVIQRTATPYRIDSGRATKSDVPPDPISAATGIVTSLRDLERFDLALRAGFLVTPETRRDAWTNVVTAGTILPTGLGWFVQNYQGEPLVWQFGLVKDAWSSLILKLPNRDLTLIMLANSDGLSAPFALENADATTSLFAKTFLRILAP